ncbi:hypothetical protein [Bacillus salipaludis]|uniref:Uncharacterized protein n=1 Tax=Bacillus salipaludis TaxID=2547811 RepID=A0ABW8RKA9_9BACI
MNRVYVITPLNDIHSTISLIAVPINRLVKMAANPVLNKFPPANKEKNCRDLY